MAVMAGEVAGAEAAAVVEGLAAVMVGMVGRGDLEGLVAAWVAAWVAGRVAGEALAVAAVAVAVVTWAAAAVVLPHGLLAARA